MAADVEFVIAPAMLKAGIPVGMRLGVALALDKGGSEVVRIAQRIVPIDKANLVSTIRHEVDGTPEGPVLRILAGGQQGTGTPSVFVDYAGYVERGTSRAPRQPFLQPALEQAARLGRFQ